MTLLLLALLTAACGPDATADRSSLPTPTPQPVLAVEVEQDDGAQNPIDQQEAARQPEPVTEPALIPVPAPSEPPTKPRRGVPTPPPARSTPSHPVVPDDAEVAHAVADLADRLGVSMTDVSLLDARLVTWRNGAVGCPEPGLAYTQAEVPGSLIVLRVGQVSYRYHAADGGEAFFCATPQAPVESSA